MSHPLVSAARLRAAPGRPSAAFALAFLVASLSRAAVAQEDSRDAKAEAKARFTAGQRHYNLNELPEALADFKDAYRLYPDPVFLFNLGQCERQLGHHEEAIRFYRNFLREQPKAPNRQEVLNKVEEMEAAIRTRPPQGDKPTSLPATPSPESAAPTETAAPAEAVAPPKAAAPAKASSPPEAAHAMPPTAGDPQVATPAELPAHVGLVPSLPPTNAAPVPDEDRFGRVDLGSSAPQPAPAPAFYRRWWFWTGVAVIAAGAGLGIYAATAGTGSSAPDVELGTKKVF